MQLLYCDYSVPWLTALEKKKKKKETEIYGENDRRIIAHKFDNNFLKSQTMKYRPFTLK